MTIIIIIIVDHGIDILRDNGGILKFVIHTADTMAKRGKKNHAVQKLTGGKYETSTSVNVNHFISRTQISQYM